MELRISMSGDVHPLPRPDNVSGKISVCIRNRQHRDKDTRSRGNVKSNCSFNALSIAHQNVQLKVSSSPMRGNKQLVLTHLNTESLKCRHHFHEIKELALKKKLDHAY